MTEYVNYSQIIYVDQLNDKVGGRGSMSILMWLDSMNVSPATKRIRLKAVKAVLRRMFRMGMIQEDFFGHIRIKVDEVVKEGATEKDITLLLSKMDLTDYFQLRDATAILLIWQTGVRLRTLSSLTVNHVDFGNSLLHCSGDIMKNHRSLTLPLSSKLLELLNVLVRENKRIADARGFDTDLLFITSGGLSLNERQSNNILGKRLKAYSKKYGIPNINAHAIRRGFAKSLLNEGVSVPVISKALGHSSLSVTTKYLHISEAEVIHELKRLY